MFLGWGKSQLDWAKSLSLCFHDVMQSIEMYEVPAVGVPRATVFVSSNLGALALQR